MNTRFETKRDSTITVSKNSASWDSERKGIRKANVLDEPVEMTESRYVSNLEEKAMGFNLPRNLLLGYDTVHTNWKYQMLLV